MENLGSFKKFNSILKEKSQINKLEKTSKKLFIVTEEFHEAQLKLQELQKKFIGISKENKAEREELKKAIIDQSKIVKQKESIFQKAIGNEDITDLEI